MMSFRDWNHRLEDLPGALFVHDGKVELGAARAFRLLILPAELTGEQATGERAPNEEADLFGFEKRNEFALEVATGDGVVGLERIEAGEILALGDAQGLGDLPGLPVRDADVADLALGDESVESAKSLFDRGDGVVRIDVVCLEAAEARFNGIHNVSTRGANVIAARADTRVSLRRKHDVLAGDVEILERLPKSRLTFTFRVDVSCIEEIDAAVDRGLDQFVGSLLVDRPDDPVDALAATKGHGA